MASARGSMKTSSAMRRHSAMTLIEAAPGETQFMIINARAALLGRVMAAL